MTGLQHVVIPTLMKDEGFRRTPYRCSNNVLTIGYGTNLDEGLTEDEAMFLLESRTNAAIADCLRVFPWFRSLDVVRQAVVVRMRYQLGLARLLGFRRLLAALAAGDFTTAAAEMLDSKWARDDSPARAQREAARMRTGDLA